MRTFSTSLDIPSREFWTGLLLVAMGVLLSASWLAPNHETPWLSFHLEVLAALAGLVLVLLALIDRNLTGRHISSGSIWLFAIAVIPILQWGLGRIEYRGDALLASAYLAALGLTVWAGFSAQGNRRENLCHAVAISMAVSSMASSGIALYQIFRLTDLGVFVMDPDTTGRMGANLGQPNHLATLLMFGLASVGWLYSQRKWPAWIAILAAMVLLPGLAATGSRHPFLGIALLAFWVFRAKSLRNIGAARWLTVGALALWWAASYAAVRALIVAFSPATVAEAHRLKAGLRPLLWDQFTSAIAGAPWGGYGWQGGLTGQAAIAIAKPGLEFSQYAHNLFLDLMVWNGAPLGLLLIGTVVIWYLRAGRYVRAHHGWFEFSIITIVLAHSLVEYPFAYMYFVVPLGLCIGRLEAARTALAWKCPRWFIWTAWGSMAIVLLLVIDDYLQLAQERRDLIVWKIRLGGDHPIPVKPNTLVLDQLAASIEWMAANPTSEMKRDDIDKQVAVSRRYPTVALLSRTVLVLAMNQQTEGAYTELLRLRGLHGDRFYGMAVDQIRGLATELQPGLHRFVAVVDARTAQLPPLPELSKELSSYSLDQ